MIPTPEVDGGWFPVKRTAGEPVAVSADVHSGGQDMLAVVLRHRPAGGAWAEVPMTPQGNDRWAATFSGSRRLGAVVAVEWAGMRGGNIGAGFGGPEGWVGPISQDIPPAVSKDAPPCAAPSLHSVSVV